MRDVEVSIDEEEIENMGIGELGESNNPGYRRMNDIAESDGIAELEAVQDLGFLPFRSMVNRAVKSIRRTVRRKAAIQRAKRRKARARVRARRRMALARARARPGGWNKAVKARVRPSGRKRIFEKIQSRYIYKGYTLRNMGVGKRTPSYQILLSVKTGKLIKSPFSRITRSGWSGMVPEYKTKVVKHGLGNWTVSKFRKWVNVKVGRKARVRSRKVVFKNINRRLVKTVRKKFKQDRTEAYKKALIKTRGNKRRARAIANRHAKKILAPKYRRLMKITRRAMVKAVKKEIPIRKRPRVRVKPIRRRRPVRLTRKQRIRKARIRRIRAGRSLIRKLSPKRRATIDMMKLRLKMAKKPRERVFIKRAIKAYVSKSIRHSAKRADDKIFAAVLAKKERRELARRRGRDFRIYVMQLYKTGRISRVQARRLIINRKNRKLRSSLTPAERQKTALALLRKQKMVMKRRQAKLKWKKRMEDMRRKINMEKQKLLVAKSRAEVEAKRIEQAKLNIFKKIQVEKKKAQVKNLKQRAEYKRKLYEQRIKFLNMEKQKLLRDAMKQKRIYLINLKAEVIKLRRDKADLVKEVADYKRRVSKMKTEVRPIKKAEIVPVSQAIRKVFAETLYKLGDSNIEDGGRRGNDTIVDLGSE